VKASAETIKSKIEIIDEDLQYLEEEREGFDPETASFKDLADNLSEMAKFRNFLVHRYDKMEDERLNEILNEDLSDVKDFAKEIYNYTGLE